MTPMKPPAITRRGTPLGWRYRRPLAALALLLSLYLIGGFFLAPLLLKPKLIALLQQSLDRPVALDTLKINPLALSAELDGFRISEKDGVPILGFDRLYAKLGPVALLSRAWLVDELRLEGPHLNLVRFAEDDSNIGRLSRSDGPSQSASDPTPPPSVILQSVSIQDARVTITDHRPKTTFHTEIGPITVTATGLSNLPNREGDHQLHIATEDGGMIDVTGKTGLNPLSSKGHVSVKGPLLTLLGRYFAESLPVAIASKSVESDLDYRLTATKEGSKAIAIGRLGLRVSEFAMRRNDGSQPFLSLPEIRLTGAHLGWPDRIFAADALEIDRPAVILTRQPDGQLDLAQLLAATPPPAPTDGAGSSSGGEWSAQLGKFLIRDATARFNDRVLRDPGQIEIDHLELSGTGLTNKPDTPMPFSVSGGVTGGGNFRLEGQLVGLPPGQITATATVTDLPLALAQPYFHDIAKVTIKDGRLDLRSDLAFEHSGALTAAGSLAVRDLKLLDDAQAAPILSWQSWAIDRYGFSSATGELQISQMTLNEPQLRLHIAKDHSTNFGGLLLPRQNSAQPEARSGRQGQSDVGIKISIGKIMLARGALDFGDQSLPLPFSANATGLDGEVTSVTSITALPASLRLRGQIGEFGAVRIDGDLTPFDPGRKTKIDVALQNVAFPILTPYAAKFAGRRIADGRLDVELHYSIEDKRLNGVNRAVMRDLVLGERIDVPGALDLPLDLAIALLKDEDGKIDLDLPVSGDLENPQFEVGAAIGERLVGLLGDLVTSPFRLIGRLIGGEHAELDVITFEPGAAELDPPARETLQNLAAGLRKRPGLILHVAGTADPVGDGQRIQQDRLDEAMAAALGDHFTVANQRQFLESMFQIKFGPETLGQLRQSLTPAGGALDESRYLAALRERIAASETTSPARLEVLAQARASAIIDMLQGPLAIPAQRLTRQPSRIGSAEVEGMIALKLEAVGSTERK